MEPRARPPLLLLALALTRLPAAIWIGEGNPMDWSDAANWSEGALPVAGETIWIRPINANTLALGGGETETLDLVFDAPTGLTLHLAEGTRLGTVTTVTGAHHQLLGAPLGGSSRWDLRSWSGFTIPRLAEGAELELASGEGALIIGPQDMGGIRTATAIIRSGYVMLDDGMGPMHAGIEVVLDGGQVGFNWDVGRFGALRIRDGQAAMEGLSKVEVGRFELDGRSPRDLREFPAIVAEEAILRAWGSVVIGANFTAGKVVAELAELDLGGIEHGFALALETGRVGHGALAGDIRVAWGTLACPTSGTVEVLSGTLTGEGLSVAGTLRIEEGWVGGDVSVTGNLLLGGGTSTWEGRLALEDGAQVTWMPSDAEAAVVELRGSWVLAGTALLAIGETDWSAPYWDANREVRLVDVWETGSVTGTFTLQDAEKGDEGGWTLRQATDGDLVLMWTALGAAPVPEATTLILPAAALSLALSARRRRARPR